MKKVILTLCFLFISASTFAEELSAEQKIALSKNIEKIKDWAKDSAIVAAVKAINANELSDYKGMTQDTWKALAVLDPKVRYFSKTPAAEFLKSKKDDVVTEVFLNAADGTKVAFLAKTSNWSHKGKGKHDDPMNGKTWQGPIEIDESTGLKSIQVAIPVTDNGKNIGSLVVGFSVTKLK